MVEWFVLDEPKAESRVWFTEKGAEKQFKIGIRNTSGRILVGVEAYYHENEVADIVMRRNKKQITWRKTLRIGDVLPGRSVSWLVKFISKGQDGQPPTIHLRESL